MNINKLKDLRKKLLALAVAGTIPFGITGCTEKSSVLKKQEEYTKVTEESTTDIHVYPSQNNNVVEETIPELSTFLEYNAQIVPNYKNEDLYITEEEVNILIEKALNNQSCDYEYKNNIDYILSQVKVNSTIFLMKNEEFSSAYDLFKEQYEIDFNSILKEVLESIIIESTNNVNEDLCNMKDLSIVVTNNEPIDVLAYYDRTKNLIAINIAAIEREKEIDVRHDFMQILKKTLRHEINHLRQYPCECRQQKGQTNESLKYDDYYTSVLMESSAESEIYNIGKSQTENIGKNSYSYSSQRAEEGLILMLGLFQENIDLDDYYNAIFDTNIKQLYEFTGSDSKQEIYELYKILYSIDAINLRNDLGEYILEQNNEKILSQTLEYEVGYGYKVEIFKKVLENMAIYTTNNKDFTLEENIAMLNIIKNSITIGSYVIEESYDENNILNYNYIYEESFVDDVYNLETNYVEFLSNYYKCDVEKIREIENTTATKILTNIGYISQGLEPAYYQYKDIATTICNKFPIITAISYSNSSIQYGYSNFLKNNKLKLVKKYD